MIAGQLYDGGTQHLFPAGWEIPGMQKLRYRDTNYEYLIGEDLWASGGWYETTNANMRAGHRITVEPWPDPMPHHMWVDNTERYSAQDGGLIATLKSHDTWLERFTDVPAANARLEESNPAVVSAERTRAPRKLSWRETRARVGDLRVRLDTENEELGTRLKEPQLVGWPEVQGGAHRLVINDSPLFEPVDLTQLDRYALHDADGNLLPDSAVDLYDNDYVSIYLRPRRWKWSAEVLAHFVWVSWFDVVYNDEWFIRNSWDRPPTYPYRHDILHPNAIWPDYFGDLQNYDVGIDWAWSYSKAAASIGYEMLQTQSWTLCTAYLFLGNEAPWITLWKEPPKQFEVVMSIGRYDVATGKETLIHVTQTANLDNVYPTSLMGTWMANWYQAAGFLF